MRTQSSRRNAVSVKQESNSQTTNLGTRLVPVLLRRGKREEFFHVPLCHVCRKPILDFEAANVVVLGWDLRSDQRESLEALGTLGGAKAFRIPGTAVVVHFECDQHKWKPWVRATSIFCQDQRGLIEKLGWAGVFS